MRAVVQRVSSASVRVSGSCVGEIQLGLCVFVGVAQGDQEQDARELAKKVVGLRIFSDAEDKMNLSLPEVGGQLLAVSQFTLLGDARKGKRPSFMQAEEPERAQQLFELFVAEARALGVQVETGRFRTQMEVQLVNEGPVTLLLDSRRAF